VERSEQLTPAPTGSEITGGQPAPPEPGRVPRRLLAHWIFFGIAGAGLVGLALVRLAEVVGGEDVYTILAAEALALLAVAVGVVAVRFLLALPFLAVGCWLGLTPAELGAFRRRLRPFAPVMARVAVLALVALLIGVSGRAILQSAVGEYIAAARDLASNDPSVRLAAQMKGTAKRLEALRRKVVALGPRAVPMLLSTVSVGRKARGGMLPVGPWAPETEEVACLQAIGEIGWPALPHLTRLLSAPESPAGLEAFELAIDAVGRIDPRTATTLSLREREAIAAALHPLIHKLVRGNRLWYVGDPSGLPRLVWAIGDRAVPEQITALNDSSPDDEIVEYHEILPSGKKVRHRTSKRRIRVQRLLSWIETPAAWAALARHGDRGGPLACELTRDARAPRPPRT
jgi:hypothetical protein